MQIIYQLIGVFWYLIPLTILAVILKSAWFKGVIGEFFVNITARVFLNKNEYRLIKNVTLPTEDGTTQIDHIIVSRYGVFVLETKNMKGWIFGSQNQRTWTQKIYKHSSKFQNPLHQNYKHVKTLMSLLGLTDEQIHSVVVFVGDSTFKTEMPKNVTTGRSYIRFIKSKNQQVLSELEVKEIVSKIETGRLTPSFKTHRAHTRHVKDIISEKENDRAYPKCDSPTVVRETKSDQNTGGLNRIQIPSNLLNKACCAVEGNIPFRHRGILISHELIKTTMEILNVEATKTLPQNCRNDVRERTPNGLDKCIKESLNIDLRTANIISDILKLAGIVEIVQVINPQTNRRVKGTKLLQEWTW